jgi:hypothetical protein
MRRRRDCNKATASSFLECDERSMKTANHNSNLQSDCVAQRARGSGAWPFLLHLLVISFMLACVGGHQILVAQTTNYTYAASSGTFTALSGATSPALSAGTVDEGYFNGLPIGFDFWYNGTRYTTVSASTNGWLTLGANISNATPGNLLTTGGAPRPVIAPLWDDLDLQASANLSYLTSGSVGSRVFTIQFLNEQWNATATGTTISFQVKLYESTGKVEFVYKPESGTVNSGSGSIGITDTATGTTGVYRSLNNFTSSATASSTTATVNIAAKPASGQTYSFTPPVPTAPSSLTFSSITATSMTLNWVDNSSNEDGFVIYKSTDGGVNYAYVSQTAAAATTSAQSGLSAGTTYYWKVYAVTDGGLSTALAGNQATTYNISGHIQNASAVAISGVTVTLSGSQAGSTTTDGSGNYSFASLPAAGNYTVTPTKTNYTFSAASLSYNNLSANQASADFTGSAFYSISGNIHDGTPASISGVTVTLTGSQTGSMVTDATGNYTFVNLAGGGNYTVTPSKANYSFNVTSNGYLNLSASETGKDFVGTLVYSISGHIQNGSGTSVNPLRVNLTGTVTTFVFTSSGDFSFTNLPVGNYTVTPVTSGYTYNPTNRTYNSLSADQTTANFTATSTTTFTVSGHIWNASGSAISGVTVTLSGGPGGSTTTDGSGEYSFSGLPATENYTVTPSKTNYTFSPGSRVFNNLGANSAAHFTGTSTITYTLSGHIQNANTVAIGGVTVTLSGGQAGTTTSDGSGNYSFAGLPSTNNYTVTPSRTNFTFTLTSLAFANLSANQSAASFTGARPIYASSPSNVAHISNGGVADASSSVSDNYPASAANDGDRKGLNWNAGGGWNDASSGSFPDWLEVDFAGAKVINEIDVFTLQDSPGSPSEPTEAMTFSSYGLTAYDVQYWNGSAWVTVSGGSITGNNKVWRKINFSPISTSKIRVLTNASPDGFSRITEVEAYEAVALTISGHIQNASGAAIGGVTVTLSGGQSASTTTDANGNYSLSASAGADYTVTPARTNFTFTPASLTFNNLSGNQSAADFTGARPIYASAPFNVAHVSNGGVTSASSTLSDNYPTSAANDGDRKGLNWNAGGGWNDGTANSFPDWLQIDFNGSKIIDEIDVFTIQDNAGSPSEPTEAMAFSLYGVTDFHVQYWDGAAWVTVPGGSVSGNDKVWRKFVFSAVTTSKIRVTVNSALASHSRIMELEAYQATFAISGHIQNASAVAISGATVTLSGGQAGTTTTDGSGNYSFAGLPATNNYTVTPTKTNNTFSAANRTYTNLSANQTTADFTGTSTITYTISGHIQNASAVAISGVTVTLSGGQTGTTTTDGSGNYSFASLPATNNYTVTPTKTNYTFSAANRTYTNLSANQTAADFTGTSTITYTISGYIQNASAAAISGVTVTLSGGQAGTTTTDGSGNYSFAGIPSTNNYTVTPTKTNYTFSEANRTYTNLSANQTAADFTGTALYTISGHIQNASAIAISGATITLSGAQTGTTTTNASGNYSFSGLPGGGNYTLTPSLTNYTFSAANRTYTNLSANQTAADFTGISTITYTISGHIQDASAVAISGVTVTLTGGQSGSTTTDASGNYSFTGLPSTNNYTVTSSNPSYSYSPTSLTYSNLSANQATADFTATQRIFLISGYILDSQFNEIDGVTVTLSGNQSGSTVTDGGFGFYNLPQTGSYTVTPSMPGYTFSPSSITITDFNNGHVDVQFLADPVVGSPDVALTASVSPTGSAAPGTDLVYTISFSNAGAASASTFVVNDPRPANTDFKVGSMTTSLGTTGLTLSGVVYSNDSGATWAYSPVSGGGSALIGYAPLGYDRNVTTVRWSFSGTLSQNSPNNAGSVGVTFRIR